MNVDMCIAHSPFDQKAIVVIELGSPGPRVREVPHDGAEGGAHGEGEEAPAGPRDPGGRELGPGGLHPRRVEGVPDPEIPRRHRLRHSDCGRLRWHRPNVRQPKMTN